MKTVLFAILLFLIPGLVSAQNQKEYQFETIRKEKVTFSTDSIFIIVLGDSYCLDCLKSLSKALAERGQSFVVLPDVSTSSFFRRKKIIEIEAAIGKEFDILFDENGSIPFVLNKSPALLFYGKSADYTEIFDVNGQIVEESFERLLKN